MNCRRIAALLRELAAEFEREDSALAPAAPPVRRQRRAPRPATHEALERVARAGVNLGVQEPIAPDKTKKRGERGGA